MSILEFLTGDRSKIYEIPTFLKGDVLKRRDQKIPYNIFQTFKTHNVSFKLYRNAKSWFKKNKEYDYYFFSDEDMINYIHNNTFEDFDFEKKHFLNAFNKIKPGAGKADLFRYLIIYDKGGIYFDIDTFCKVPLRSYIKLSDEVLTGLGGRSDFHQWGLIYTKHHPFMKKALEVAVNNIINEHFINNKKTMAYLCGPPCLDYAIKQVLGLSLNHKFREGNYTQDNISYRIFKKDFFNNNVKIRYKDYQDDIEQLGSTHWSKLDIFNY